MPGILPQLFHLVFAIILWRHVVDHYHTYEEIKPQLEKCIRFTYLISGGSWCQNFSFSSSVALCGVWVFPILKEILMGKSK